eukprot:TRINITY_DN2642_c0_g1_i1.p1 TRINITY_DN2642_c0_g1~~TRINITY_DN2642_c0_g1_i1.p1  ORF type:complete len:176 (+),score=22.34 TRINITY_DN2642_c0_g1_i1:457-984(+)
MLLGGEQLGEKGAFLSIELPAPVAAGLGIGAGSLAANVLTDYVTPMLFDDSTIRSVENTVIKGSLAASGSIAGLYYLSGIGPSVNGGLLGLGSFVGGEYLYSMDSSLLGRNNCDYVSPRTGKKCNRKITASKKDPTRCLCYYHHWQVKTFEIYNFETKQFELHEGVSNLRKLMKT